MEEILKAITEEAETSAMVTAATKLADIVEDSLSFLSLVQGVGNRFGVRISVEHLQRIETVGDLAEAVLSARRAA